MKEQYLLPSVDLDGRAGNDDRYMTLELGRLRIEREGVGLVLIGGDPGRRLFRLHRIPTDERDALHSRLYLFGTERAPSPEDPLLGEGVFPVLPSWMLDPLRCL